MKDVKGILPNHWSDPQILDAEEISRSTMMIAGFPLCAIRDPDLSIADLRVLICICARADRSGRCAEDTSGIARQANLPEKAVIRHLECLQSLGYLCRGRHDGASVLELVSDAPAASSATLLKSGRTDAAGRARRKAGRTAQASLHSGMLRRPRRRQAGAIEFDDTEELHPVVASWQDSIQDQLGDANRRDADRFRFWLKTILDPEDVAVFLGWADRQSAEYRELVGKFEKADDDDAIEALLEDTLALVDRERTPNR